MNYIKPEFWHEAPNQVKKHILNNCELDYCYDESSRAEATDSAMDFDKSDEYHQNWQAAQSYYNAMTSEMVAKLIKQVINSLREQIEYLSNLIDIVE